MKIMNISDTTLFVNNDLKRGIHVGLNKTIFIGLDSKEFIEMNPEYKVGEHFIIVSEEFDEKEIAIDPEIHPLEIVDNPPRIVLEAVDITKTEEEQFEAAEALLEVVTEQEIETPEEELVKSQEDWEQFFLVQTKNNLKEFAGLKGIPFQVNASKAGMIEVLTKWLNDNNLINNGENNE